LKEKEKLKHVASFYLVTSIFHSYKAYFVMFVYTGDFDLGKINVCQSRAATYKMVTFLAILIFFHSCVSPLWTIYLVKSTFYIVSWFWCFHIFIHGASCNSHEKDKRSLRVYYLYVFTPTFSSYLLFFFMFIQLIWLCCA